MYGFPVYPDDGGEFVLFFGIPDDEVLPVKVAELLLHFLKLGVGEDGFGRGSFGQVFRLVDGDCQHVGLDEIGDLDLHDLFFMGYLF